MNVERTIEFILNAQAKAEIRMDKMDKRIDVIAKLLQQGMRILVRVETAQERGEAATAELRKSQKRTDAAIAELKESQKRTDIKMAELAQAQKETQRSLKAFLDSMRHRRNGG